MSAPVILALMSFCFLFFGYLGVPVPFALLGGVFVGATLADVSLAAIIPLSGILIALFTIEQMVNGVRNGFEHPEPPEDDLAIPPIDTIAPMGTQP